MEVGKMPNFFGGKLPHFHMLSCIQIDMPETEQNNFNLQAR
jgi:hypothetical protein